MSIKQNLLIAKCKQVVEKDKDITTFTELLKRAKISKSYYYSQINKKSKEHKELFDLVNKRRVEAGKTIIFESDNKDEEIKTNNYLLYITALILGLLIGYHIKFMVSIL